MGLDRWRGASPRLTGASHPISTKYYRALPLVALAAAVALVLSCGPKAEEAAAQTRPNLVFIMTDDQPKGLNGAMPNVMNRIAGEGMSFPNAYVTESLCCPSRASMLRGEYPHNTGVEANGGPNGGVETFRALGEDQNTVATQLRASGYTTALVGKYINGYDASYTPPGWDYFYGRADPSLPGQKVRENDHVIDYTGQPGNWGDRIQNHALDFMNQQAGPGKPPFALLIWTGQPHLTAADYADRYAGLYQNAQLPDKPSYDENVSDKPQWIQNLPPLSSSDMQQLTEWHQNQLRSVTQIDDMVGNVLDSLNANGEMSNTYTVFTTDNGTGMGEHRWWYFHGAKSTPYEEAANVPMFVRGPGIPYGDTSNELVLNQDLAPTFETIAGLTPPSYTDGRNILPAWQGESLLRAAFLNERPVQDGSPMPPYQAALSRSKTYVEWQTGEKEYYDRATDPYEDHNAYNPAVPSRLAVRLAALSRCAGLSCQVAEDVPPGLARGNDGRNGERNEAEV
jgi:N-acetylglucosamine-6-sulfatase